MSAYAAMFGNETEQPSVSSNVVAPKKSKFSNVNPQLQAEEDDLDSMMLNAAKGTKQPATTSNEPNALQRFGQGVASLGDVTIGGVLPIAGQAAQAIVRPFTTPQRAEQIGQQISSAVSQPFGKAFGVTETPGYKGEASQQLMNFIGENVSKGADWIAQKTGLPIEDVRNMVGTLGMGGGALAAKPLAAVGRNVAEKAFALEQALPKVRVESSKQKLQTQMNQQFQPAGAAASTNETMLNEAINRASPELAAELRNLKPEQVNKTALENQLVADTLPIPVRLTKGQASQDPSLISFERNERGMKEKLSQHFNEQNKALQENAEQIKQRTAEGTFEPDYVANSERAIEAFKDINNARQKEIKQAYEDLDKLGAGKIEVDSKSFGNNALKALTENEDIDFLPPIIKSKIEAYEGGKPMNFAQYENLRTQIARETRKAQRADDGNAVHALTIARSELEKLPLLNETAEAKVVADKARSLAAQEFGLLDKRRDTYNPVYAEIVNGSADTKDFVPKVVLRSKNADFAKALDMLKDNPDAIKQLRAGTLDYIIRESTDASGNFKTGKFTQLINNLDVNKKLTALFGEDSQVLKDLARTGQLIEARPRGSFVNESNTSVANMASQYAKGAAEQGINVAAKGLPIGTMGRQFLEKRAAAKQVEETLKPGAGVKLKNIGKD